MNTSRGYSSSFVLLLVLSALLFPRSGFGQSYPLKEDVATLDGIMKAYYEVVSGPAGQPRQEARDASLHMPGAQVLIVGRDKAGDIVANTMTLSEYHERARSLVKDGFFEYEIRREVRRHGAIAHVWSTYEWRRTEDGPVGGSGINSVQLYFDGARWWITSWMFDGRSDAPPVPKEYLPG